jgi:hypothetical protein
MAMQNHTRITPTGVLLLLFTVSTAWPIPRDTSAADSLKKITSYDSLHMMQNQSRLQYTHASSDNDPFAVTGSTFFSANSPTPSDAFSASPLCLPVQFGLSHRLNRSLLYGSPAPLTAMVTDGPLLLQPFSVWSGSDDIFTTEFSSITLEPNNRCRYDVRSNSVMTPEAFLYWENGVFNENVLAVRFSRPLSRHLLIDAFSNYRFLSGMRFSHEGNGIYSFYSSLASDTAVLSNKGYNLGANDYSSGIKTIWSGKNGNDFFLGVKYADQEDEFPLNQAPTFDIPSLYTQNQYHTTLDCGSSSNRLGPLSVDLQARYDASDFVRHEGRMGTGGTRSDGANREMLAATCIGSELGARSKVAIVYQGQKTVRRPFLNEESDAIEQCGYLEGTHSLGLGSITGTAKATAGVRSVDARDSLAVAPEFSASVDLAMGRERLRGYGTYSAIPWFIPYDTSLFHAAALLDRYLLLGGEIELKRGAATVLLGCQSVTGIDSMTVLMAWSDALIPYSQSPFTFLAAPRIGPWRGFTVESSIYFSGEKPLIKMRNKILFSVHPAYTKEFIDIAACFDYWSERNPITFAGASDWNRPVYDLALEYTVHISAFRFFGKADNLLNRKFAYVPGYYSPGVTFRWGFGWYLQK